MKKLLLALLLSLSLLSTAQEFKTPVDYLTYINKEQGIISRSTWKYTSAVAHSKSARRIDNTRKQLIKTIQTAKKKIGDIKNGYNGDVEYQNQVIQYFDFCEKNLNEEYDKIINMQEVAEQSYDAMEAYLLARDLVNEKLDSENEKASAAFNAFALKYNIKISEGDSELGKKIKISNEVFDYHTVLYLVFFKVNFTDASLAKAVQKKDMAAIEQNANALLQYANEGLEKIKTIAPYNKDVSLITATKKVLEYYKKEAETHVPKIVSFYMFNDKFENTKKTIESKSQKDRTKEEIDNYNDMVKQVNKEIDTYNKANNLDFQDKQNAINNWNTVAENFISKHVPVD
ncbi:LIC11966 family surface protein [Flavobacterium chungnamense]|uniref:YiiG family protein n=1 Tax=Flavobacterium chungnamense TaxID=706182 RepID=A0ABP7UYW9_9FLAO